MSTPKPAASIRSENCPFPRRHARLELVHEVGHDTAVNPRLGERFDKAVQAAAKLAAEFPDLGSPYFYGTRRVLPKKFKFSVVYLTHEQELFISP